MEEGGSEGGGRGCAEEEGEGMTHSSHSRSRLGGLSRTSSGGWHTTCGVDGTLKLYPSNEIHGFVKWMHVATVFPVCQCPQVYPSVPSDCSVLSGRHWVYCTLQLLKTLQSLRTLGTLGNTDHHYSH